MSRLFFTLGTIVIFAFCTENVVTAKWAKCWTNRRNGISQFGCFGVGKLSDLDKASENTNSIVYHTSNVPNVEGNVFWRFRNFLINLDLHKCQIETIDQRAFSGLTNLKNLTLWGNKLSWIPADWFTDLLQLTTLDVSFNSITMINEMAFTHMPKLENLFIDYNLIRALNPNVFSYLLNLKYVKLGKNPWDWWFRAMISRELDNQHVDYNSEWDDYHWLNYMIWNCVEKHNAKNDDNTVLDCVSTHLLKERSKITDTPRIITACSSHAKDLYDCTIRTDQSKNLNITSAIAIRKILEGFMGMFSSLLHPDIPFKYLEYN